MARRLYLYFSVNYTWCNPDGSYGISRGNQARPDRLVARISWDLNPPSGHYASVRPFIAGWVYFISAAGRVKLYLVARPTDCCCWVSPSTG